MNIPDLLAPVKDIARDAGAVIMRVYEGDPPEVTLKEDDSPLTRADRESNTIICARLEKLLSGVPVLSEENHLQPWAERQKYGMCWLVDPLDGTKEFISRNGEFTINIALIELGVPVLGVVYVPCTGEMYSAVRGVGAQMEHNTAVTSLSVPAFAMTDKGLHVVCSRSHLDPETRAFIDKLQSPETVSRGSALKFMMIAAGEAHLYPRLAPTMEWDTAAAQCILEVAGGFVVDFHLGTPLRYNKENLLNPSFLAGGRVG